jgi:methionyl-tRNA synthetase
MKESIKYDDFAKLDLCVGRVLEVENIIGADKLYKLTIDIGDEERTVCAGIKEYISKDDLKGRQVILLVNLEPRKLKGIESQGMILAAVDKSEGKVVLLQPFEEIREGTRIS